MAVADSSSLFKQLYKEVGVCGRIKIAKEKCLGLCKVNFLSPLFDSQL